MSPKHGGQDADGHSTGDGKAIRGASAIFQYADQALSIGKPRGNTETRRVLRAIGRRSESPRELLIELWGDTALSNLDLYGYNVIGTPVVITQTDRQATVLGVLTDQPKTLEEIKKETGIKKHITSVLVDLVSAGKAEQLGEGVRGDPWKWRLKGEADAPTPVQDSVFDSIPSLQ